MARNSDLDRLLREVDSLTGSSQTNEPEQAEPAAQPMTNARKESSFLKSLGGFFISKVEDEPSEAEAVDSPPPSPYSISEVAGSEPAPDFSNSMSNADDLSSADFAQIYAEAGIDESSFTIDKLAALLDDPTLKDQPLSTKTLVLKMALKAQNVTPETPVTDAVRRDRALDSYQKMLNARAQETEARNAGAIGQINEEVKAILEQKNREMDVLREETQEMRRQAETFAARRQQEEQRLAQLVVPLLEGQQNPVSVNNKPDE
jgi:hypothetical protein